MENLSRFLALLATAIVVLASALGVLNGSPANGMNQASDLNDPSSASSDTPTANSPVTPGLSSTCGNTGDNRKIGGSTTTPEGEDIGQRENVGNLPTDRQESYAVDLSKIPAAWKTAIQRGTVKNRIKDANEDGAADFRLAFPADFPKEVVNHVAGSIQKGSLGKVKVYASYSSSYRSVAGATPVTIGPLGQGVTGLTVFVNGKTSITIIPGSTNLLKHTLLHECLHALGVSLDGSANKGNSIMDYSYTGIGLTQFDRAMLQTMYP